MKRLTKADLAEALKAAVVANQWGTDPTGLRPLADGVLQRAYHEGLVPRRLRLSSEDPELARAIEAKRDIEAAVEEHMERIRDDHYLCTVVTRRQSIDFLTNLAERLETLAGEITHEMMKHGDTK